MSIIDIAPQKTCEKDQYALKELWGAFLENYNAFKNGQMQKSDEFKYKLISSPGPSQYCAFFRLFKFFTNEELIVEEQKFWDYLYMYDWVFMNEESEPAMLRFVMNINNSGYDPMNKTIVLSFGSFWQQHLPTREKMISELNELYRKGAKVCIYAQAKDNDAHIEKLDESIRKRSFFGLQKRIPIHYVRVDYYVFLEFPHTETTEFRLNWLLDLNSAKYKWWKTKNGLVRYFDSLTKGALK
jgi:hypothetical protein